MRRLKRVCQTSVCSTKKCVLMEIIQLEHEWDLNEIWMNSKRNLEIQDQNTLITWLSKIVTWTSWFSRDALAIGTGCGQSECIVRWRFRFVFIEQCSTIILIIPMPPDVAGCSYKSREILVYKDLHRFFSTECTFYRAYTLLQSVNRKVSSVCGPHLTNGFGRFSKGPWREPAYIETWLAPLINYGLLCIILCRCICICWNYFT